jgi:bla regulator protein BlaR1
MHASLWNSALANHLWQSTLFVATAWLLSLALRKNQARIRYSIWWIASIKFLVPLSIFIDLGHRIGSSFSALSMRPAISKVMQQVTMPFPPFQYQVGMYASTSAVPRHTNYVAAILFSIWILGSLFLFTSWSRRWWHLRIAMRHASVHPSLPDSVSILAEGVPVLSSPLLVEPGVFGIVQPVLMLPEGITDRLEIVQLQAIVAHEMCHIRRRDNLTFALHMLVETIFWFHPFVWWIRLHLIEERERACDEAVLQSGNEAQAYAESILNVCKFYVESPLPCVSGVTGSDLKERIVRIMSQQLGRQLSLRRKLLLSTVAIAILSVPMILGIARATTVKAQEVESSNGQLPKFEVATIKPYAASDNRRMLMMSPGKFSMSGMPIKELIRFAYDLKSDQQLTGSPGWIDTERFDVEAKEDQAEIEAFAKLPPNKVAAQVRLMVQSLLADRFNLKVSHDTRELPVYALVVDKNGSKLTPTTMPPIAPAASRVPGDGPSKPPTMRGIRIDGNGQLRGMGAPIEILANMLSREQELGDRLVVDKTGLTGLYDWTLKWTPETPSAAMGISASTASASPAPDANAPSLFTALEEQLGLKLEAQKAPVSIIVINQIDHPTAN